MPNEAVLPLAMSGAELKKLAHDQLDKLMRSCHLNDNLAYPNGAFIKITFQFKGEDVGRKVSDESEGQFAVRQDENGNILPADPEEYAALEAAEASIELDAKDDPTGARIESGQPVPVRVTDKSGRDTIREVRYRRDAGKK